MQEVCVIAELRSHIQQCETSVICPLSPSRKLKLRFSPAERPSSAASCRCKRVITSGNAKISLWSMNSSPHVHKMYTTKNKCVTFGRCSPDSNDSVNLLLPSAYFKNNIWMDIAMQFPTISYESISSRVLFWDHSSESLDFYAIKPNESLTVTLSLESFADLSLTAWELPAKTSNEIFALAVVTGEGWNMLFPNLFSSFLSSLHLKTYWGMSSLFPFLFLFVLLCLSLFSSWLVSSFSLVFCRISYIILLWCRVSAHCNSKSGWGTKMWLPPLLHRPTAGIMVAEEEVTVTYRKHLGRQTTVYVPMDGLILNFLVL